MHHDRPRTQLLGGPHRPVELGRRIRPPHTRWEIIRHGACTASTGIAYLRIRDCTAPMSWLADSAQTISSTPSYPRSAAKRNAASVFSGYTDAVDNPTRIRCAVPPMPALTSSVRQQEQERTEGDERPRRPAR